MARGLLAGEDGGGGLETEAKSGECGCSGEESPTGQLGPGIRVQEHHLSALLCAGNVNTRVKIRSKQPQRGSRAEPQVCTWKALCPGNRASTLQEGLASGRGRRGVGVEATQNF